MKKLILLSVLTSMICTSSYCQYSFDWMQSAGNNSKIAVMSAVDNEDNLIVTGYWQNFQLFTRKYDNSGTLLWEVSDESGISGMYEKPNWITSDSNNNILVVGNIYSYSSSTGWDYPNALIALKYDPSGQLLWKKEIPISITITTLNRFNASGVMDNDDNLYIGTVINSPEGATLYKIDTDGNLIFSSSSMENLPRNFSSIRIKNDRIAMASGSPTTNVAPIFIFDTSGALLWTEAAEGLTASDVEIDDNLNVYVLSSLQNVVSPTSGMDMRITKYDINGIYIWEHDYDLGGNEISRRFQYLNGRISAIGYGSSSSSPYFDWKTMQTDSDGTLLWNAIYDATSFNDEEPYHILAKPNGAVIVTGKGGPSPDPNNPSFIQMPIVEYDNAGNQIWMDTPNEFGGWGLATMLASDASLYAISSSDMTVYHYNAVPLGVTGHPERIETITLYPNPAYSNTTIQFNSNVSKNVEVTVLDVLGNSVIPSKNLLIETGKTSIDIELSGIHSGLYFCVIYSEGKLMITKLLKL